MKKLTAVAAVAVVLTGSYVAGMKTEYMTHAYQVHALTGASLWQVLDPLSRFAAGSVHEDDHEEVCSPSIPCESNQD